MIHTIHKPLCSLFLLFSLIGCLVLSQQADAKSKKTVIADGAGLFSTDDSASLTSVCNDIATRYNTAIYIISSNTIGREDDYAGYLDTIMNDKKSPENMILLFISTKTEDSFCAVLAKGDTKTQITQDRCDSLAKAAKRQLRKGDAYTAVDHFTNTIVNYFETKPFTDFFFFNPILQLLFCFAVAGITLFLAAANPLPKQNFRRLHYASDDHSGHLGHLDTLLRTSKK